MNLNFFFEEVSVLDLYIKNKLCISKKIWDRIEDKMFIFNVIDIIVIFEIIYWDEFDDIFFIYVDFFVLFVMLDESKKNVDEDKEDVVEEVRIRLIY